MDQAFGRKLLRHKGNVSTIIKDEIVKLYERITEHSFQRKYSK